MLRVDFKHFTSIKKLIFYLCSVDSKRLHSVIYCCAQTNHADNYSDVIMGTMASQITSLTIVYSRFIQRAYQRKHQSSASLAFVRGIHRWPMNSPHKGSNQKMFPFDDVIMIYGSCHTRSSNKTHPCTPLISTMYRHPFFLNSSAPGQKWRKYFKCKLVNKNWLTFTITFSLKCVPGVWLLRSHHYRKVSNIRRTTSQNLNASRLIL